MAWARNSSGNLVQPPNGGSIGSQADVARAIYDEVGRWEGSLGVGDEHKLVLNLSLGWHPAYGGSETRTSMPVPVRAVYDALRYASCKDALVIAAAGHEDTPDSGSQADGPLYPAAWESEPATTSSECLTDFLTTSTPSATGTYTPLIYAVGGVDVHLNPLPISRPGSMPSSSPSRARSSWYERKESA